MGSGEKDENDERGNWTGKFDFILSCLGFAVGLGNVWRFPYICYKNGGGAFFIPYCLMLVFVGMPIFFLELALGQFCSSGPFTCWKFAPIFSGIGMGMFIVSAYAAIYYNMIIAWGFYYLFASMQATLPWQNCKPESETCLLPYWNATNCTDSGFYVNETVGVCYNETTGRMAAIWDKALAKNHSIMPTLPSAEYLSQDVLGNAYSDGLQDLGGIRWQILLCYLLSFIVVCLSLSKSIKTSGKVVYFTATFPFVVLLILFVRGVLLDHFEDGIMFYITPDLTRLSDATIWKDAAVQIFFSLSASWGGLIALSSYNKFHTNCLRDALVVSIGNCITSVFAGFVIFSYLGNLSHMTGLDMEEVAVHGPTLAFVVYPFAVTQLPLPQLWSILFFIMIITLGIDSEFVFVETVITSLLDRFPKLRKYKFFTVSGCCTVFFLLGLTLTTNGGVYMLELMDTYSGGWNILVIAFLECLSITYFYGTTRFLKDIEVMIGQRPCCCISWEVIKYWWAACWLFFTPVGCLFIMIFSWVDYTDMEGEEFPGWADAIGWLMTVVVVLAIIVIALYLLITTDGSLSERLHKLTSPTPDWGPGLVKHRKLVVDYYDDNFVLDPWGNDLNSAVEAPPKGKDGFSNVAYIADEMPTVWIQQEPDKRK